MERFNGNCPKCNNNGLVESTGQFEWNGDFVVAGFECDNCGNEFTVLFDNGKICDD